MTRCERRRRLQWLRAYRRMERKTFDQFLAAGVDRQELVEWMLWSRRKLRTEGLLIRPRRTLLDYLLSIGSGWLAGWLADRLLTPHLSWPVLTLCTVAISFAVTFILLQWTQPRIRQPS